MYGALAGVGLLLIGGSESAVRSRSDVHTGTAQAEDYIAIDATAKFKCVLF